MGGAADHPQRSSSPLKRRASDIDNTEVRSSQGDVDMIPVPSSDPAAPINLPLQSVASPRTKRAQSIDMLRDETDEEGVGSVAAATDQQTGPGSPSNDLPPIDVQIKTITALYEAELQHQPSPGDKVYLVSKKWLNRVISRGSDARKASKEEPEGEIGPVDNSDIVQQIIKDSDGKEFVQLKHGYGTEEFIPFPDSAWKLLMHWYDIMPGSKPIIREAYNTNPDKNGVPNIQFEYHPPIFTIHRLHADNNGINISQKLKAENPAAPLFVFSRSYKYQEFLRKIKAAAGISANQKVRVWRVPRLQPAAEPFASVANTATPPSSRPGSPAVGGAIIGPQREIQDSWTKLFLDVPSFTQLERGDGRELVDFPDHSANSKYNGSMDLSVAGLGDTQTIILDEAVNGESFVSNYVPRSNKAMSTAITKTNGNSQTNSGRNSPVPSGPMTRGRTQKAGKQNGTAGLSNLGNTCYMNSALQCVRSVEELTKYFLTGTAKGELNFENPLGNHGDVAKAYEALLEEIYRDPSPTSVAPRHFKTTIGRYAPSFSGWGQQDSQEFLGFLLDGLQEDLSRVKKKPYIEKPDSTDEMVNNPEAIRKMAAQVWDITKKRDDSVIADLFTGMYKSTLVCPVCSKVSITFDPFNNLTLQLPIENSWSHDVYYYPLNDRPVIISVDIDKNAPVLAVKEFVSKQIGVPAKRLFAAEQFKNKFYRTYDDSESASEAIGAQDTVGIYELEHEPTNWPPPEKAKKKEKYLSFSYGNNSDEDDLPSWDDPLAERLVVSVFHRRPNTERSSRNNRFSNTKPWILDGVPHFITVTPEEARSEDSIRRKILEKAITFSTQTGYSPDEDEPDHSVADSGETDMVLTTSSDADSSGGSKVVANSVDGEDELVDVTMNDASDIRESIETNAAATKPPKAESPETSVPLRFNTRRPAFLPKDSYLPAELQNMFTLGYFVGSKEMVPTGWHTVDEDKIYPTLSSRNPQISQSLDSSSMSGYEVSNGRAGSESSEFDNYHADGASNTRMTEESSDEDADIPAVVQPRALPLRAAGRVKVGLNKRGKSKMKTYSKKGKQLARPSQDVNTFDQDAPDEGPLIRLGEGIVVDWKPEAWEWMFGGDGPNDTMRGSRTWGKGQVPELPNPALDAKRKARMQRRKNGITLDDCLDEFGKEEVLSEADTWYCPRCKEHRRATKKFELWKTPDILVMHLKRFSSHALRRDKLDVFVDFPIDGLDLTSRVIESEEGKDEIYDLFAVDDHYGGLGGGHYTAFAKNFIDGQWYEYNDSSSTILKDVSRVVSSSAYLLFYRRRSDLPLGGPRFQEIFRKYENPNEASDDEESGEDQGLVENSSHHGSSRALTGVGAVRQRNGSGAEMMTVDPSMLEKLPDYQAHLENDDDTAPLLLGDAAMNDDLRASIEDEGIDMSMGYNSINYNNLNSLPQGENPVGGSWNFSALNVNSRQIISGAGSDIDNASDIVNHDSVASAGSLERRHEEFDEALAVDEEGNPFEEPSPVPDLDEDGQAAAIALQADLLEGQMHYPGTQFDVTADDERLEVEEPATEIHLEDHDDLKLD